MSNHNAPNPVDSVKYDLIDTFNRTGNIQVNSTPTLGVDWESTSLDQVLTNPAGYLAFGSFTSYAGGDGAAFHQIGSKKKIAFDLKFPTGGKAFFLGLRNNNLDPRGSVAGSQSVDVKFKDTGADFTLRVDSVAFNTITTIYAETRLFDAIGANGTVTILIEETGTSLIIKVNDVEVTVDTSIYAGNSYFLMGGNTDSFIQVSKLRVW